MPPLPANLQDLLEQACEATSAARTGRVRLETAIFARPDREDPIISFVFDTTFDLEAEVFSASTQMDSALGATLSEERSFLAEGLVYTRSEKDLSNALALLPGEADPRWVTQPIDDVFSPQGRAALFEAHDVRRYAIAARRSGVVATTFPAQPGLIGIELHGTGADFARGTDDGVEPDQAASARVEIDPFAGLVRAITRTLPLSEGGRIEHRLSFYGLGQPVTIERPPPSEIMPFVPVISGKLASIQTTRMLCLDLLFEGRLLRTDLENTVAEETPAGADPQIGERLMINGWAYSSGIFVAASILGAVGVPLLERELDLGSYADGDGDEVSGEARVVSVGPETLLHDLFFVDEDGEEYPPERCPDELFVSVRPVAGEAVELHRDYLAGAACLRFARRADGTIITGEIPE